MQCRRSTLRKPFSCAFARGGRKFSARPGHSWIGFQLLASTIRAGTRTYHEQKGSVFTRGRSTGQHCGRSAVMSPGTALVPIVLLVLRFLLVLTGQSVFESGSLVRAAGRIAHTHLLHFLMQLGLLFMYRRAFSRLVTGFCGDFLVRIRSGAMGALGLNYGCTVLTAAANDALICPKAA